MNEIIYATDRQIDADAFTDLLRRSTLAERRPVDDADCIAGLLSAPAAAAYYPRVGFERHPNAFVLSADGVLRR